MAKVSPTDGVKKEVDAEVTIIDIHEEALKDEAHFGRSVVLCVKLHEHTVYTYDMTWQIEHEKCCRDYHQHLCDLHLQDTEIKKSFSVDVTKGKAKRRVLVLVQIIN